MWAKFLNCTKSTGAKRHSATQTNTHSKVMSLTMATTTIAATPTTLSRQKAKNARCRNGRRWRRQKAGAKKKRRKEKCIQQPTESLISLQENNVVGFRICITEFVSSLVLIVRFFRMSLLSVAAAAACLLACLLAAHSFGTVWIYVYVWMCLFRSMVFCISQNDSLDVSLSPQCTSTQEREIFAPHISCANQKHPTNHTQLRVLIKNNLIFHLNSNKTR